jgi:hypothetical protein
LKDKLGDDKKFKVIECVFVAAVDCKFWRHPDHYLPLPCTLPRYHSDLVTITLSPLVTRRPPFPSHDRLDEVNDGSDIQDILANEITKQRTVPQIFINQVNNFLSFVTHFNPDGVLMFPSFLPNRNSSAATRTSKLSLDLSWSRS